MADAAVSNTAEGNLVWVRIPPSLPGSATSHPPPAALPAGPIRQGLGRLGRMPLGADGPRGHSGHACAGTKSVRGDAMRTRTQLLMMSIILLGLLANCGGRATSIPAGAQQVHVAVTESGIRLDPAIVPAGDVYVVLDTPGSSVGFLEGENGPLSDVTLARVVQTGDSQGTSMQSLEQARLLRRAARRGSRPAGSLRERRQGGPEPREVRVLHRRLGRGSTAVVGRARSPALT